MKTYNADQIESKEVIIANKGNNSLFKVIGILSITIGVIIFVINSSAYKSIDIETLLNESKYL